MSDLPQFLLDLIGNPPASGDGVHLWLFRVARQLHAHRKEEDIFWLFKVSLENCGRVVPDREIWDAVNNSKVVAWQPRKPGDPVLQLHKEKIEPDFDAIDCIVRSGYGLADVWEQSPVRLEGEKSYTEEIIDVVFPGNPLLCCGKSKSVFATRRRKTWRGRLSDLSLIVPSPMTAVEGLTQAGDWVVVECQLK